MQKLFYFFIVNKVFMKRLLSLYLLLFTVTSLYAAQNSEAIFDAAAGGKVELVKALIAGGVKVDIKSSDGLTPLHFAAYNGYQAVCVLLLQNGTDINAQSESGNTPLHYAAFGCRRDICALLLQNGAHINVQNYSGNTPLHDVFLRCYEISSKEYFRDIVLLFLANININIKLVNNSGRTPEEEAKRERLHEIAQLISNQPLFASGKKAVMTFLLCAHPRCGADSCLRVFGLQPFNKIITFLKPPCNGLENYYNHYVGIGCPISQQTNQGRSNMALSDCTTEILQEPQAKRIRSKMTTSSESLSDKH